MRFRRKPHRPLGQLVVLDGELQLHDAGDLLEQQLVQLDLVLVLRELQLLELVRLFELEVQQLQLVQRRRGWRRLELVEQLELVEPTGTRPLLT